MHFTGEAADTFISHAEPKQPKQENPKDRGEKLVEINLATREGESQSIFISANLPVRLRHALFTILQELEDVFMDRCPDAKIRAIGFKYKLNVKEVIKAVKQMPKNLSQRSRCKLNRRYRSS